MAKANSIPTTRLIINSDDGTIDRVFIRGGTLHANVGACSPNGYKKISINGYPRYVHRVIWEHVNGAIPKGFDIDHINRIKTDNRIANLRLVTRSQNNQNRDKAQKNSKLGIKGITKVPSGKYKAQLLISGKQTHIGTYESIELAKAAYDFAVIAHQTHSHLHSSCPLV